MSYLKNKFASLLETFTELHQIFSLPMEVTIMSSKIEQVRAEFATFKATVAEEATEISTKIQALRDEFAASQNADNAAMDALITDIQDATARVERLSDAGTTVEEVPTEEPTEETPVEEVPVEETPTEEAPAEEVPADGGDTTTDETTPSDAGSESGTGTTEDSGTSESTDGDTGSADSGVVSEENA